VSKVVVVDVAWTSNLGWPRKQLHMLVLVGIAYQYWAAAAWLLAATVPVVGELIGAALMHFQLSGMASSEAVPPSSYGSRRTPASPLMCYPYFYFQWNGMLEALGLREGFDARHNIRKAPMLWEAGAPRTLFVYGADKGFQFHPSWFEKKLEAREGCRVVGLRPATRGAGKVGHWLQTTAAAQLNDELDKFLQQQ